MPYIISILITILSWNVICIYSQATQDGYQYDMQFSAVVAFGDSFTDNGNGSWLLSNGTWPQNPNYYEGRFSNGPVWIEYVAGNLSVPLVDYAVGGATTSNNLVQGYTGPNSTIPVPSIDQQVSSFLADPPSDITTDYLLFVLYGGANDVLFNSNLTAAQSFREILASQSALLTRFPNATFLVLDYPDLSRIPYAFYIDWLAKQELHVFSQGLNSLYRQLVMQNTLQASAETVFVELPELFDRWEYYAEPLSYGFDPLGAYGSCLTGVYQETDNVTVCSEPDLKVFWDEYHPTSHAHSYIAAKVLDALRIYSMRLRR